jgi:hypothetical protein
VISDETLKELLRKFWGLADGTRVVRHDGGMGSQTWIVEHAGRRWVAKSVAPHLAQPFARGLQVAQLLDDAGIRSGAPALSLTGSTTVGTASGDRAALLTWVPGRPLTGASGEEQRLIGNTLARVHRVLRDRKVPGAQHFHWVDPAAAYLSLRPWLRSAVTAAVDALTALRIGTRHGRKDCFTPTLLLRLSGTRPTLDPATSSTGARRTSVPCCMTWPLPSCTSEARPAPPR